MNVEKNQNFHDVLQQWNKRGVSQQRELDPGSKMNKIARISPSPPRKEKSILWGKSRNVRFKSKEASPENDENVSPSSTKEQTLKRELFELSSPKKEKSVLWGKSLSIRFKSKEASHENDENTLSLSTKGQTLKRSILKVSPPKKEKSVLWGKSRSIRLKSRDTSSENGETTSPSSTKAQTSKRNHFMASPPKKEKSVLWGKARSVRFKSEACSKNDENELSSSAKEQTSKRNILKVSPPKKEKSVLWGKSGSIRFKSEEPSSKTDPLSINKRKSSKKNIMASFKKKKFSNKKQATEGTINDTTSTTNSRPNLARPVPTAHPSLRFLGVQHSDDEDEGSNVDTDKSEQAMVSGRPGFHCTNGPARPSMMKRGMSTANKQKSSRNHLRRVQSRKFQKGKSIERTTNVLGHQMHEIQKGFTLPVFQKGKHENKLICKTLKDNFIFESLSKHELKAFIQAFEKIEIRKGEQIIKQGDMGDYFYIIAEGEVTFEVNGVSVGSTSKGKSFGELALLYMSPRAATVLAASEPTCLFRVDHASFRHILHAQTKKLEEEKINLLKKVPFLKDIDQSDLTRLSSVMTPRKFKRDEYVVRKGETGDAFYILKDGQMSVTDISVGMTKYEDVILKPGAYFGERALITSEPRAANVVGKKSGTAFWIDRYTFEKVLGNFSRLILKSQDKVKLEGVKLLKTMNLDSSKYNMLSSLIVDKKFKPKEMILGEDDDIQEPALYLVREGKVQITTDDGSRSETIEAGGYFGDEQLLADVRIDDFKDIAEYTAAVSSEETCVVGMLTLKNCRTVFETHKLVDPKSGDRRSLLTKGFSGISVSRKSMKVRDSIRASIIDEASMNMLDRRSVLGEGQFGEVWLVAAECEQETESFALKIQSKNECKDNKNLPLDLIKREVEVMQSLDYPFIVDLIHHYETETSVYMMLSLVVGGELWDLIHRQDADGVWSSGIPEDHAKFYTLVIADTLAYMHNENVIFRDLKPENILVDEDGYPIIVDFGFAKICADKTYTFCGTPNYLAPEIIQNRGHGAGVDHWALGVVIYEMIVGENPFYFQGLDQVGLYSAICQEEYFPLPDDVDLDAFDIIDRLLEKDPNDRLGMLAGREKDILTHEWFDDLDLVKLRRREAKAPWIPTTGTASTD